MSPSEQANRRASGSFSPMIFRKQKTPSGMDPDVSRLGFADPWSWKGYHSDTGNPRSKKDTDHGSHQWPSCLLNLTQEGYVCTIWFLSIVFLWTPFLTIYGMSCRVWFSSVFIDIVTWWRNYSSTFYWLSYFFCQLFIAKTMCEGYRLYHPSRKATLAKATAHSHWAMEVCVTPGAPLR